MSLLIASPIYWGILIKKKTDFHLENEILVFKVGALVQRKKGMVYIFVKHEIL